MLGSMDLDTIGVALASSPLRRRPREGAVRPAREHAFHCCAVTGLQAESWPGADWVSSDGRSHLLWLWCRLLELALHQSYGEW